MKLIYTLCELTIPTNKINITNNLKPMGRWDITAKNAYEKIINFSRL